MNLNIIDYYLKVNHHQLYHMSYVPLVVIENGFFVLLRLRISPQISKLMAPNKTGCLPIVFALSVLKYFLIR